ncbi:MAG: hypothetical protein M0Z49_10510 [Chloroflexi bacterium]|nr:hypothetical protein [Chloroflexota bacterium]
MPVWVRPLAGWAAAALAAAIVLLDLMMLWPGASGTAYVLSLAAGVASDGLIVGLLALVLLRPVGLRSADRGLVLGAVVFALAVVYRVGINLLARLAAPSEPTLALPTGPYVDPLVESGLRAVGAWLLAAGIAQLVGARRGRLATWSGPQLAAAVSGICVAGLILAAAAFVAPVTQNRGEVPWALEVLAWTVLGVGALTRPLVSRTRWLVAAGAGLLVASSAVAAVDLLVQGWWWGPVRAWFPALLNWHGAYVYVGELDFLGWAALWLGLVGLTLAPGPTAPVSTPKR